MAVGLGTVDMPVPSIAGWEWLNWSFPRPVYAGDTVYARWTLTQKRPPVAGAESSIIVWRVDVHTADGALCAEGEIGAKVKRESRPAGARPQPASAGAATPPPTAAGSRRRRHRSRANGTAAELPAPPAVAAPPAPAAKPERAAGPSRRRRRRRSGGSAAQQEEHEPRAAHVAERAPEPAPPSVPAPVTATPAPARGGTKEGGIGRVLKRLRRS